MRASPVWLFALLCVSACAVAQPTPIPRFYTKTLKKEIENSPVFAKSLTGFTLLDPETGQTLCDVQGDHYFTPASTAKILTLATCLSVLGDSVPAFRYYPYTESEDTDPIWYLGWIISGTGDPTFLHPRFQAWQTPFALLKKNGLLGMLSNNRNKDRLGAGWTWDDYNEDYSPEPAEMPLYGNMVHLTRLPRSCQDGYWQAEPPFFQPFLKDNDDYDQAEGPVIFRQEHGDTIFMPYYSESNYESGFTKDIPIWRANAKTADLLLDTLHVPGPLYLSKLNMTGYPDHNNWRTLYSTPLDTVLRRMMFQSDNFIAEQMLMVCQGVKYDTLRQDKIIRWAKDTLFASLISNNQAPRWVDGSGLSRYNLVTPRYLAGVLHKLWREQPHDRLLALFPTAGAPETTLEWWLPVPTTPWLFAKTGSMSGVQCMSGYLRTKRGKVLIFSFMHNNFVGSGKPWRLEMQRILELLANR